MLTRILVLVAAVCVIAGAPVHSLPGVTLTLKQVTLHEVLMKLSEQTNWKFTGPAGEGSAGGVDLAKAKKTRASFEWKNASLSTACSDVGKAFGLVPLEDVFHHIYFKPGRKPPALIAATRVPGASIGVLEIARQEDYLLAAGSPKTRLELNTRMTLVVRRDDGDPDRVAAVEFLNAVDNLGLNVPVEDAVSAPHLRGPIWIGRARTTHRKGGR